MTVDEKELKRMINLSRFDERCILYGRERQLLIFYRQKLFSSYEAENFQCSVFDSKETDFMALMEDAMLVSMFSGKRAFFIDDFDSSAVSSDCWEDFLSFCKEKNSDVYIIITAGASFDEKNNSKDKKLLSCFSKDGCAVNFEKHVGTVLRDDLRSLCKKERVDLSGDLAAYLIDICGDDLGILKNECLKMCAFTGQDGKITKEMIDEICTKKADANIYAIANLIIKKDMRKAMREINTLLSQKVAVIQIISNLNISFYGLYCASCARSAGKTADEAACDLKEKFLWRMKNYYRDSNGIDNAKLYAVCRVMCEAENRFKSSACEERVLLEKAVAQCISILI